MTKIKPMQRISGMFIGIFFIIMVTMLTPTVQGEGDVIVADPTPIVTFGDPFLEGKVRTALNKPTDDLTAQDLSQLTSIAAADRVTSLEGMEYAINLTDITIRTSTVSDLTPLAHLTKLKYIDITSCQVHDLTPLAGLTNLEYLSLEGNFVSDLTPLKDLPSLNALYLGNNNITNLAPLGALQSLEILDVKDNFIENIEGDWSSSRLLGLYMSGNLIRDLSSFATIDSLKWLHISYNPVTDLDPLQTLNLEAIQFYHTEISDLSALRNIPSLKIIGSYDNPLSEASTLFLEWFKQQDERIVDGDRYSGSFALPKVFIDGKVRMFNTVQPMIYRDSTMLPLRELFNLFGADVHWDGATRTVTATLGNHHIELVINSNKALVNDQEVDLVAEPIILNEFTMIPFRFVAEAFGYNVEWYDEMHWVMIDTVN